MGPIILDVAGLELTSEDKEIIRHPLVGGLILFARNFESPEQLIVLIHQIRQLRPDRILITVDHEGGHVQRFRRGFTRIPYARAYAALLGAEKGAAAAKMAGWLMAMELTAFDIDLSFAPVLDLGHHCPAIGDRSFHKELEVATKIANAMIMGLHEGGMKVTGKHFPGHGAVKVDTHKEIANDKRLPTEIERDMYIFSRFIQEKKLDAVMPAHVIYSEFDALPASGSAFWLKTMLRQKLGFNGVIFSDDLSMDGAKAMGDYAERTRIALGAGVDMALICNNRLGAIEALEHLPIIRTDKPNMLLHKNNHSYADLVASPKWQRYRETIAALNAAWSEKNVFKQG